MYKIFLVEDDEMLCSLIKKHLESWGYQVTAADVTEEMLKEAKKNTGVFAEKITWKLSDAQKLELEDCAFDAVFSRNVTWNLENP